MLSCDQYDYIEIACLYHYAITLTLVSGEVISGTALDTARNEARAECIKLAVGDGERLLPLVSLTHMTAAQPNPHFTQVDFD
ncbi:Rho-binding antiterminator [Oceanimonas doudoroffii]|uniref:Transcriptional regulator n=1 Tax=Oceanimonas doudoroffii TaxID=84158 RepID=A0A233RD47_9GAMM|nr:Rho-binding antiterminator [Oceanimonas doudoroffii]OXY81315.1 transcriptional regulator [Oceanimonas doudoroffii]